MNIEYPVSELMVFFFLYGFLGWLLQVVCVSVKERRYVNLGVLNLPFAVPFGLTAVVLQLVLPTLDGHPVLQFFGAWGVMEILYRITDQVSRNVTGKKEIGMEMLGSLPALPGVALRMVTAFTHLAVYLVIHPFVFPVVRWLPDWLVLTAFIALTVLTVVDFFSVRHALRTERMTEGALERSAWTRRMADRVNQRIWKRLEKAYPGVAQGGPEVRGRYVFAKGICFDKLVWVFLISSFLGALIEMCFCYVTAGQWMNRSSLLYGAFSVVWGFGAVVLTVVLQRMAGKEDRKVFLAGALVGGVYEYLCSVFTELVFGTVFWDYSSMPLNIGGRTNLLYCIFWGILSVVWINVLYPPMERSIEKIPPLPGKILTWCVVAVMLCNGALTAMAMCRYTDRQENPEPDNAIELLLDEAFPDARMENRWPNMKLAEEVSVE